MRAVVLVLALLATAPALAAEPARQAPAPTPQMITVIRACENAATKDYYLRSTAFSEEPTLRDIPAINQTLRQCIGRAMLFSAG